MLSQIFSLSLLSSLYKPTLSLFPSLATRSSSISHSLFLQILLFFCTRSLSFSIAPLVWLQCSFSRICLCFSFWSRKFSRRWFETIHVLWFSPSSKSNGKAQICNFGY